MVSCPVTVGKLRKSEMKGVHKLPSCSLNGQPVKTRWHTAWIRLLQVNSQGMYRMRLYNARLEEWQERPLDDLLPCEGSEMDWDFEATPLATALARNHLWVRAPGVAFRDLRVHFC